jgi:hypothetical protein
MSHALQTQSDHHVRNVVWMLLPLWFLLALAGSLLGIFQRGHAPPISLGLMAVAPILLFAAAYLFSAEFSHFVLSANPRILTAIQSGRVLGVVFVILYYRGILPAVFALPAGYGDMFIGLTAPLVAWAMSSQGATRRPLFVLWNALGILDLVMAVTLGVLSSDSSIGILASGVTTQLMGAFPLSLIPTFLVPLFTILHLITLARLREVHIDDVTE